MKVPQKIESTIEILPDLILTWSIERDGMQDPAIGDNVIAVGTIALPLDGGSFKRIDPRILFGARLAFYGQNLYGEWGSHEIDKNRRSREQDYMAPTWAQAFNLAYEAIEKEIKRLIDKLAERAQALQDAEIYRNPLSQGLQRFVDVQEDNQPSTFIVTGIFKGENYSTFVIGAENVLQRGTAQIYDHLLKTFPDLHMGEIEHVYEMPASRIIMIGGLIYSK